MFQGKPFLNLFQSKTTSYPNQKEPHLVIKSLEFKMFCMLLFSYAIKVLFLCYLVFFFMLFLVKFLAFKSCVTICKSTDRKKWLSRKSHVIVGISL